ncbi:hypothetical protein Tamer19_74460 [Cupriavidus sp. TA19]|nr:hypothetical protein Tamer19_74460 [Cupriavidus sp. TA19]
MAAAITLLDMTAQGRGTALLDGAHDTLRLATKRVGVQLTIRRTVAAQDVRQLQRGRHERGQSRAGGGSGEMVEAGGRGRRSKGLVVAHTVLVATFR